MSGTVSLSPLRLSPPDLFRRATGRNLAALSTKADLVWYSDVDQTYGEGCLDELWKRWQEWEEPKPTMIFPKEIMIHKDHATGDEYVKEAEKFPMDALLDINPEDFKKKSYNRAVGGVQIVDGNYCREHGYARTKKWAERKSFGACTGDLRARLEFRRYGNHPDPDKRTQKMPMLPNFYRLRHGTKGRDLSSEKKFA